MSETSRLASALGGEVENQTHQIDLVARRIADLAEIGEETAAGAERSSSATAQQLAALGELAQASERLSDAAARLLRSTERFRVDGAAPPG